jgi:hypothetical protein
LHYFRYVDDHKKLKLDQEPNFKYLGHPINAYHLIRHSALGWKYFHLNVLPKLNTTLPHLSKNKLNLEGVGIDPAPVQTQK